MKYAQTVDSFSMPTINQEDYLISFNNYTFQNIVQASYSPQKDISNKIINSNNKIVNKKKIKNSKNKKKVNKVKLFKISKKTSSNI